MNKYSIKYVGMDVHKETIAVAIAKEGRGDPAYYGEIPNTSEAIKKLIKKLASNGEKVSFCYEAGPCGYDVYRQLINLGQRCDVSDNISITFSSLGASLPLFCCGRGFEAISGISKNFAANFRKSSNINPS